MTDIVSSKNASTNPSSMKTDLHKEVIDIQKQVNDLRVDSLKILTHYLMISMFFLLLILFHRLTDSDWNPIYLVHFISIAIGGLVLVFYKKLSYRLIIYSYIVLGLITAEVEFLSFGIGGLGDLASLFCLILALFYLDKQVTAIIGVVILVLYTFAAYQFISSGRVLSDNDLHYMSWYSSWIGTFVAAAVFFSIVGLSTYYLQTKIIELLAESEHQKKLIEQQKEYIEHLANHDELTGLPSLRVADARLDSTLDKADQHKHKCALLFLDLDGFKAVNDTYGHDAGDAVLKQVAERLLSEIRESDTACRIGGDEFLIIIEKIANKQDIEALCQRLIDKINAPVFYQQHELFVGTSIGAVGYPCCGNSSQDLRSKADALMYQVKRSGKNNYLISINDQVAYA